MANSSDMAGGLLELECHLLMNGADMDTGEVTEVMCPISCYDAAIRVDMILSYEWLGRMNFDVGCQRHGLLLKRAEGPVWVPGVVNRTKAMCKGWWRRCTCRVWVKAPQWPPTSATGCGHHISTKSPQRWGSPRPVIVLQQKKTRSARHFTRKRTML